MDPGPIIVLAFIAAAAIGSIYSLSRAQEQRAAWETLAGQLGLQLKGDAIQDEYEGVTIHIFKESRRGLSGYTEFFVVQAQVPGDIPRGFVAAPRRWTSGLERMLADNLLSVTEPALKECYLFQSDRPDEGQALINDAAVQQALIALYNPLRVGYVEKKHVHVAYKRRLPDVEEAWGAVKDVVHAARTLAEAHSRLALSRELQSIS